jgi:hypothetical protein
MAASTLKLFLPQGDPKGLRTAEVSNWTGKAIAAPRSEFKELLKRDELQSSGIYFLLGTDPETGDAMVYIGEAEIIRDRLKAHTDKDFWIQIVVFVSKDENLTKAHIRYLEGRLIDISKDVGRVKLFNGQASGSRLPESDQADMEVFLSLVRLVLPVMGSDMLTPVKTSEESKKRKNSLFCETKGLKASGMRTPNGFVVFKGSQAVLHERPSASKTHPGYMAQRAKLVDNGSLEAQSENLVFTVDVEFSSPSAAGAIIVGGGAQGTMLWRDKTGKTLKEIEQNI